MAILPASITVSIGLLEDQEYGLKEFYATIDTALIGRKTHDFMVKHGQPAMPGIANYVFSRSAAPAQYEDVHWVKEEPLSLVQRLKAEQGKDIWLVGGSNLAQLFFENRLIDEVALTIMPILLGGGIQLFPKIQAEIPLKLTAHKAYASGVMQLTYACD
jgi:dihydrofolate reductase